MPENTETGFDWTRIIKPAATAASLVPALWLKGQRKEDWLRGVGGFWSGVAGAEERRRMQEQNELTKEHLKARIAHEKAQTKVRETQLKGIEAEANLRKYQANRPSGVGRVGTPSMIGQTRIGGDVTLSPERLNWIRSQMGGGARPVPPTGQRLKPSPSVAAGEMRPELFETGTPMTGQEKGQFLESVGTTAGGMLRPDLFGKPPTPKEKSWIDSSGRLVQKTASDYQQAMGAGEVLTDNVKGYTQTVNAYYEALEGADDKKKRAIAKQLGHKDTKSLAALLDKSSFLREMAIQRAIEDYTEIDFSKYEK